MTHVDPSKLVVGAPVVTSDATVTIDASVTNPVDPGDHLFQLIVVDENGVESIPAEQRVTISPDDRKPQAVLTAMPAEVAFGQPFTLDGTESRSEEHTSELQSQSNLVCRLLLEKKKKNPTLQISYR